MFENKSHLKIISLLAAIILWMYVMGEVDPETSATIYDIPVNLTGTDTLAEYGMAVALDEEYTITAVVSGKRSDVNLTKRNGLTATVDVSECEEGDNIERITVNLPSGLSLESVSEATMEITVEALVYEDKPVEVRFADAENSSEAVQQEVPRVLGCYPDEITVSGAKSSVDKVKKLIGYVNAEDASVNEDKWVSVELTPANKHGREILNVELAQESTEANIRMLTLKNVDLDLTTEDEDIDIDMEEMDIPKRIRIAGPKDVIRDLETVKGVVSVDDDDVVHIAAELPENVFIMLGEENGKIVWN